jgi:adenylate cyclase
MGLSPCKYELIQEFQLPRSKVWELVSQTDHLNRMIGLFAIQAKPPEQDELRWRLEAKVFRLIPLKWDEHPFEWKKNESYTVIREYLGGPMKRFYGGVELSDATTELAGGGHATLVRLFAEFTPSNLLGRLAIPLVGKGAMKKTLAYLQSYLEQEQAGQGHLLPEPKSHYNVDVKRLDVLLVMLRDFPLDPYLIERFREHLTVRGDDEVVGMRPNEWYQSWGVSRDDALRLLLYATRMGIVNLSWHLICPNCRVSKVEVPTLSELKPAFHCDFCGITYQADFDRSVELRFSVHPQIRTAYKQSYCVGGPALFPHIEAQRWVSPQESVKLQPPHVPYRLRIRVMKENHAVSLQGRMHAFFRYQNSGWEVEECTTAALKEADCTVTNATDRPIVITLEREDWDETLVTAAYVSTMPEFRTLFSSEVLAPGTEVGVETLTFLFSDLLGSTAYYEQVGDARAYGQVRRHFEFMREWIEAERGTIVKTIGDAVMAIFATPSAGLRAALEIQRHVDAFNQQLLPGEWITIKLGLHTGPAIAVNSNDKLDYFGRTVNMAARIQGLSQGNDIIISRELLTDLQSRALLDGDAIIVESFAASLKGIDGTLELLRLTPLLA